MTGQGRSLSSQNSGVASWGNCGNAIFLRSYNVLQCVSPGSVGVTGPHTRPRGIKGLGESSMQAGHVRQHTPPPHHQECRFMSENLPGGCGGGFVTAQVMLTADELPLLALSSC